MSWVERKSVYILYLKNELGSKKEPKTDTKKDAKKELRGKL